MAHKVLEQREAKKVTAEHATHDRCSGDTGGVKPVGECSMWPQEGVRWEVCLGIGKDRSSPALPQQTEQLHARGLDMTEVISLAQG